MRILIACEMSGVVREAFRQKGHDAWSCDILPSLDASPFHITGDVLPHLRWGWDLLIGHPPCTYLCNSGVRWLHTEEGRRDLMRDAAHFFVQLQRADISKICLENPIPHKYAKEWIGNYTQLIQPWQFGHGETKATCLWLKNLPKLEPTQIVEGREPRIHRLPPSKERATLRSITFKGIAEAMAQQWG